MRNRQTDYTLKTIITGIVLSLLAVACTPHNYAIPRESYVLKNRNYTYAIYNKEHRLMTHPLKDLELQFERRQLKCEIANLKNGDTEKSSRPISDIYIVYTLVLCFMIS